jgi:hypothetical protein
VGSNMQKSVEIWDLRAKSQGIYKTMEFDNTIDSISFDATAKHMMIAA